GLPGAGHGPRAVRGRQREAGRPLLLDRVRDALRGVPGTGDGLPALRRVRPAGRHRPVRRDRRGARRHLGRRARPRARRRRRRPRADRAGRRAGVRAGGRGRGPGAGRADGPGGRARQGHRRRDRDVRGDPALAGAAGQLLGRLPARVRRPGADGRPAAAGVHRDRPLRGQRRARPDGRVGRVLPPGHGLHEHEGVRRRRHRHGVLRAHVEGRRRRLPGGEVPAQRAGAGQEEVADRRIPGVLRRPGRAAPGAEHRRHRRLGAGDEGRGRGVPGHPGLVLRRPRQLGRRHPGRRGDAARAADPGRPGRGRLPAADLHQAGAGPADGVLRADRAARVRGLRQGQLQGPVRGHRARAGPPRQPL
ncbi:MAG: 4-hydroxyphenylpyruvate dioxygenase, partial [uncultured Corynebacteriales bacterium]